jgi:Flp pilus assembly protein TadG
VRNLIFRPVLAGLARRLTGLRDDGGRGAVAVLVAVLMGSGVLLGMAALVVDVGQLYQNKAELQNGADAAALAVAKNCSAGNCASALTTAAQEANANASSLTGGTAHVDFVCGVSGAKGTVQVGNGRCPITTTKNVCPANPPDGRNYVDVQTSTLLPNSKTVLPPVFAGTLVGGDPAGTVHACAQAQWDGPANASGIGITISACTFDGMTATGTTYALPPPYPPNPPASLDQVVYLKGGGGVTGCSTEPNGAAAPGNFGWTDDAGGCMSAITGPTYTGNAGNNATMTCLNALLGWQQSRKVVTVPIYWKVSGTGQATYTLQGTTGFVVTGFFFGNGNGKSAGDWMKNNANPCSGSDRCISGFFVHQLQPPGSFGSSDLGLDIIKLTG